MNEISSMSGVLGLSGISDNFKRTNKQMVNMKSMQFNLNKDSLWLSYPLKTTSFKK